MNGVQVDATPAAINIKMILTVWRLLHLLQNAKYGGSKGGYSSSAVSSDGRYEGRMRDSPNGNSYSPAGGLGMGMAVDRDSPRSYTSKPLYKKERENRDYKLSSSRDKYSGE